MLLGLPSIGSKAKIAKPLIDAMVAHHEELYGKKPSVFIDLFGGGGAMSLEASQRDHFKKVIYNEIDLGISYLFKSLILDGMKGVYRTFQNRQNFNIMKNSAMKYSGIVQTCYSFNADRTTYIYSPEKEEKAKLLHWVILFSCEESLEKFNLLHDSNLKMPVKTTLRDRRKEIELALRKEGKRFDISHLLRLEKLTEIGEQEINESKFIFFNGNYKEVDFSNYDLSEICIYADIPYLHTKKYKHDFDREAFNEYAAKHHLYLSEYQSEFKEIFAINKKMNLSTLNRKTLEKLFFT